MEKEKEEGFELTLFSDILANFNAARNMLQSNVYNALKSNTTVECIEETNCSQARGQKRRASGNDLDSEREDDSLLIERIADTSNECVDEDEMSLLQRLTDKTKTSKQRRQMRNAPSGNEETINEQSDVISISDTEDETALIQRMIDITESNQTIVVTRRSRKGRGRGRSRGRGRWRGRLRRDNLEEPANTINIIDNIEIDDDVENDSLDLSFLEDQVFNGPIQLNEDINVKIHWMSLEILKINLRKYQKFSAVFKHIAETKSVQEDQILLILRDDTFITPNDTPDSLKLTIADIIEGGITSGRNNALEINEKEAVNDEDVVELKILLKDRRKPIVISIRKTDTMKLLMIKCAEELEVPIDTLKFMFDGEELDKEATPVDLDLEGGEVIDVKMKS